MTDQNRSRESEGSRRPYDDEEQQRRRDRQDEWRREHPGERSFARDDEYARENRGYGAGSSSRGGRHEYYGQEQGGYGAQRHGERDSGQRYGEREPGQRYGERDSGSQRGQDYGGSRFGQSYGGQRYGGQEYGSPRYGQDYGGPRYGQDYGGPRYGGQDYGGQRFGQSYGGQRYGGQDYESERHSGVGHSGLTSSPQHDEREGLYGRSGLGAQQRGEHRGKGPKGYKRSDDRIREDVCDRLSDDDELDASEITVSVKDGEVTLDGSVSDRRSKQRAEDLAESVGGVRDVDNKLRKNKGMLQEMGDKLSGSQNNERGYAGTGTKNTPPNASMSR